MSSFKCMLSAPLPSNPFVGCWGIWSEVTSSPPLSIMSPSSCLSGQASLLLTTGNSSADIRLVPERKKKSISFSFKELGVAIAQPLAMRAPDLAFLHSHFQKKTVCLNAEYVISSFTTPRPDSSWVHAGQNPAQSSRSRAWVQLQGADAPLDLGP